MENLSTPSTSNDSVGNVSVDEIRKDFPIFDRPADNRLVYLDSGASSQRPRQVLEAMDRYYSTTHANVHRGVYRIAEEATRLYEQARVELGEFIGAPNPEREIVFTKNATEALNLVSQGLGRKILTKDSAIVLTEMEHHANLVPWMILQEQIGFEIRYIPFDSQGILDLTDLDRLLDGASILGVTMIGNVLGTINPVADLARAAHAAGALLVADGAQHVPHMPTNVEELGIDLMALTGHKMLGPTGIGALWAKESILDLMMPFLGGGDMIEDVRLGGYSPNVIPYKFEAGTPPIAEAIGLGEAVRYLKGIGMENIHQHDHVLVEYAMMRIAERFGSTIKIHGPQDPALRGGLLSIEMEGVHPHDLSQVLDEYDVCVRAGHHCAKPLMKKLGVGATARASFYLYNDTKDVDALIEALAKAQAFFA